MNATPLTKSQAIKKYEAAAKLRHVSPLTEWRKVFPTVESLATFRVETGHLCWPGSYGESPWEKAYSVAGAVTDGKFTPSTLAFWERRATDPRPCEYDLGFFRILESYGFPLSETLKKAIA